ncbi:DEKNAAC102284 [Brettanomyces naardenensis]|uniref:DEKNAAC102284 n=1 Tax=Brettanomyces naardenensis TaxID=13370 RepID=A0A448YL66_BRENA|nr:DEKNAAC102284 [Brettanomyces naardenensis]
MRNINWAVALAALVTIGVFTVSLKNEGRQYVYGRFVDEDHSIRATIQHDATWPDFDEPLRDLRLKSLNFLHTTDTHGWYLGHLNQKQFSSDWGDYISFGINMRDLVESEGGDLLLVDTGDRHDGNGLSDLTFPHGELSDLVFMRADYDLITVGNHELYEETVSKYEYEKMVPYYGERFISTNVEYLTDSGEWRIFGNSTYRYFETRVNGYKVLSLSFLFNFLGGNSRIRVTPISEIIRKKWLTDLLTYYSEEMPVDALVVFGHIPVTRDWEESLILHEFLRSYFPDTVIQYFGGHSHIRDFAVYDELSTALQSGRYCETVGFLSLSNFTDLQDSEARAQFTSESIQRRYIDFNLHSFMHHSKKDTISEFNTRKGLAVSKDIEGIANELKLGDIYGYVPHNFYMSTANYFDKSDKKSLLRFLEEKILVQLEPKLCSLKDRQPLYNETGENSRSVIINTGSIRYDMYKGPFTRNALFTVSPFSNKWKVIPGVPRKMAARLQGILNAGAYILSSGGPSTSLLSPHQEAINMKVEEEGETLQKRGELQQTIMDTDKGKRLSFGYTTRDELGVHGDDTIHRELPNFHVPNVIQSFEGGAKGKKTPLTDVVFYDFIESHILWALKIACGDDTELYESLARQSIYYNDCAKEYNVGHLLKLYVEKNWSERGSELDM